MDISTFNRAKAAYDAREWETASILFSACTEGPGSGEANHLRGNALMRLGRVQDAVESYRRASADSSYPHRGAVLTNLGKAQVALGDYKGAITSLRSALEDPSYPGAYKAWLALGGAYSRLGDARSAGIAYRKAALEANNPDPAKALINLGVSFVQMRRPEDAASAYRTALDFSQDASERDMILSNLGQAYVASNRMAEAVQSFTEAVNDGYQLLPPAQADFERAKQATASLGTSAGASASTQTADMIASMSGRSGRDPLDPTGRSGEIMPSPEQSGFFTLTDEQIEAAGKAAARSERSGKRRGGRGGLLAAIIVVVVVILALVGCLVAYFVFGAGIPSQASVIDQAFSAAESGSTGSAGWASSVSSAERSDALAQVQQGSTHRISGIDYSMGNSSAASASVKVTLPDGGELDYNVSLQRSGLAWAVASASVSYSSLTDESFSAAGASGTASGAASTTAAPAAGTAGTATGATAGATDPSATVGAVDPNAAGGAAVTPDVASQAGVPADAAAPADAAGTPEVAAQDQGAVTEADQGTVATDANLTGTEEAVPAV